MFDFALDFIPLNSYTAYFDFAVLICILLIIFQCQNGSILQRNAVSINATWGILLTIVLILYMGLRPISSVFGDTVNYARGFEEMAHSKEGFTWSWQLEWLFTNLQNWFAKYSNIHCMFLFCSFLYIGSLWLACVRIFKNYYYVPLIVIFAMFTFWAYGVNGVRNGIGASIFILAMTFTENLPVMISLAILALGFHSTVLLMIAATGLAWFIKNSYYYLSGWIICVSLSLVAGGRIQTWLSTLSFMQGDERFSAYLSGTTMAGELEQMTMTFRWDFLIYSAIGVVIGYYFIFRKNYKDEYYHWIYNTYLATNAFWVLVIRAAYSNRFAQISWFILPLVLIYPFMKKRFWLNHEKVLAIAIIVFYAFGFYTNLIKTNEFDLIF